MLEKVARQPHRGKVSIATAAVIVTVAVSALSLWLGSRGGSASLGPVLTPADVVAAFRSQGFHRAEIQPPSVGALPALAERSKLTAMVTVVLTNSYNVGCFVVESHVQAARLAVSVARYDNKLTARFGSSRGHDKSVTAIKNVVCVYGIGALGSNAPHYTQFHAALNALAA